MILTVEQQGDPIMVPFLLYDIRNPNKGTVGTETKIETCSKGRIE